MSRKYGDKMWGLAPMIVEGMYPGARTIGRANRFSVISPVTKAFSGVIQTDQRSQHSQKKASTFAHSTCLLRKEEIELWKLLRSKRPMQVKKITAIAKIILD